MNYLQRILQYSGTYFLIAVILGALKSQLQHLGKVKVLGWKNQKSITSN